MAYQKMTQAQAKVECEKPLTVSNQKQGGILTPLMDKVTNQFERILNKVEDKIEEEFDNNVVGLFSKIGLCVLCFGRIFLGDNDADVVKLRLMLGDRGMKDGLDKELLAWKKANPRPMIERSNEPRRFL